MFTARSKAGFAAGVTLTLLTMTLGLRATDPANETRIQGSIALPNQGEQRARYATMAKISVQQALDAALSRQSGKPIKAELQDEGGFLVYNVEVVTPAPENKRYEVKVDAGNGSVLRVDGPARSERESERDAENEADGD